MSLVVQTLPWRQWPPSARRTDLPLRGASAAGNALTSVGLTIPSYALLGVLVGIVGIGVLPSVIMLVFFGFFPILRNVLVGLTGVDKTLVESARGMGMSRLGHAGAP